MSATLVCTPVGWIESPYKTLGETPKAGRGLPAEGVIHIHPEYRDCMRGLEQWEHIYALCWFDKGERDVYLVHPRGDQTKELTGVFAARSPSRPNPISLTFLDVVSVHEDRIIVRGLDLLDGTPVLDIKPFLEHYDCP